MAHFFNQRQIASAVVFGTLKVGVRKNVPSFSTGDGNWHPVAGLVFAERLEHTGIADIARACGMNWLTTEKDVYNEFVNNYRSPHQGVLTTEDFVFESYDRGVRYTTAVPKGTRLFFGSGGSPAGAALAWIIRPDRTYGLRKKK
jgi:hypothetical protein